MLARRGRSLGRKLKLSDNSLVMHSDLQGEFAMKHALITLAAIGLGVTASLSDTPVSETDATNIRATMQAWGCSGGKIEQESEGTGVFEVDDAKCKDGQYDLKRDKEFKVISITRD